MRQVTILISIFLPVPIVIWAGVMVEATGQPSGIISFFGKHHDSDDRKNLTLFSSKPTIDTDWFLFRIHHFSTVTSAVQGPA